jgi:cytoskeletal protein CcmA (bactofilin family)
MAEKRDQFTYEDLKREPGNLIEARDWNTAMWAIAEVGTRLTALGDAVPRNNGANTLTGPLTIEDALTVGNHVVIRSLGTDSPAATLEVAGEVQVGTDATINGTLSVSKDASINGNATITQNATITGNATVSGTLTVTERVRIQKNAISEGTNDYQLEIFSPNTSRVQDYVKIRFHQASQYYAWLGYHGLAANTAGEFVFFDLNAKKEAKVRAGALTCTADAQVQGQLNVTGALKVSNHLTVEGSADITDIVTAKDVHLDGTSVAEMLRNWRAKEETPIAWKTVEHQFQPNAIAIEIAPDGQTISLRGLTVPAEPDMPMAREQILSLHGVVEIPVHFIPPIDGASISGQERLLCQVVSLSLEPVYTWPQPQDATQHWILRAIEVAAPPWARNDHDLAKEWRRRQRARQDLSTQIATLLTSHKDIALAEIAELQARYKARRVEIIKEALGEIDPRLTTEDWVLMAIGRGPGRLVYEDFQGPKEEQYEFLHKVLYNEDVPFEDDGMSGLGLIFSNINFGGGLVRRQVGGYKRRFNTLSSAADAEYQPQLFAERIEAVNTKYQAMQTLLVEEKMPRIIPIDHARDREVQALFTHLDQLDTAMEWWKRAPGSTSNAEQSTEDLEEEQRKGLLETQLDTLITLLITREKQTPDSALGIAAAEYDTIQGQCEQKKREILIETVDPLLLAALSKQFGGSLAQARLEIEDTKSRHTYEDINAKLHAFAQGTSRSFEVQNRNGRMFITLDLSSTQAALEEAKRKNEALDTEYTPQITRAKTLLEQEERQYRAAAKKREVSIPGDLDQQWQQLWAQLDHIERDIAAQRRVLPIPACVRGFSELAPWTLRLLITYATRIGTPPVAASRGLPTRVPMRLTA